LLRDVSGLEFRGYYTPAHQHHASDLKHYQTRSYAGNAELVGPVNAHLGHRPSDGVVFHVVQVLEIFSVLRDQPIEMYMKQT
jgi:hypothetical protein